MEMTLGLKAAALGGRVMQRTRLHPLGHREKVFRLQEEESTGIGG